MKRRTRTALVTLAVSAAMLLPAGCAGSGESDKKDDEAPVAAQPDLPKPVQTTGTITEPAMQPLWLLRSTGTEDSTKYEADSQGLLLDGKVALHYTNDSVLGLSSEDGEEVWKNPVDLGGELISGAADTITENHHWTYTYASRGEEFGDRAVTIDVRDGSVVADLQIAQHSYGDVERVVTVDDVTYIASREGIFRVGPDDGQLALLAGLADLGEPKLGVVGLAPVQGTTVAVVSTSDKYVSADRIVGIDLVTGKALWQRRLAPFADSPKYTYLVEANSYDGRWVVARDIREPGQVHLRISTLDPSTGEIVAKSRMPVDLMVDGVRHLLRLESNDTFESGNNQAIQAVGDNLLFQDDTSITLIDPAAGKALWSADTTQMTYAEGKDPESALGPISADGKYVYAAITTGVAGDLIMIDLADGTIVGRWALDPEQAAGLLQKPLIAVEGTTVALSRNQAPDGSLTDYEDDTEQPLGSLNDVGLFQFPDLE